MLILSESDVLAKIGPAPAKGRKKPASKAKKPTGAKKKK